jgi:hypothetical protein
MHECISSIEIRFVSLLVALPLLSLEIACSTVGILNKEIKETGRNTMGDVSWAVRDISRISYCCRKAVGDTSMHGILPLFWLGPLQFFCSSCRLAPDERCAETPGELPQQPREMLRVLQRNTGRVAATAVRGVSCIKLLL